MTEPTLIDLDDVTLDAKDLRSGYKKSTDKEPPVFFISDLHLDPTQTDTIALSLRFFAHAKTAKALFIIGDLFEYWLGDDGADPRLQPVFDAITAVAANGTAVYLMHGNRDFLLGEQFASRVGATLLRDDHVLLKVGQQQFSLLHGDTLCTDDEGYQGLRTMVRDTQWQAEFLSLSIDERIAQAQALREKSKAAVNEKSAGIMDVNEQAVVLQLRTHANDCLIHGHTHRPANHVLSVDTKDRRRLVLGDWKPDHAMIARFEDGALTLERFE